MPGEVPNEGGTRRSILRQVVQTVRCGTCGARFRPDDLTVIESSETVWMLMAVCPGCDTQAMVMVVVKESLTAAEPEPGLDPDDVLDFYALVEDHEGDMRCLLGDTD